jgi:protein-S-isoprenylcysteine O-methyltransferase Ste14
MGESDTPRVFVPPPLIFTGTLLVGLFADGRLSEGIPPSALGLRLAAAAVALAGLLLIVIALGLFRNRLTRPEPWQPATALVTGGLYRFTRNPMYLGMAALYAGIALLFLSPVAVALLLPVVAIIDRLVIAREEAYLARRFGSAYETYRQSVRRWI